VAKTILNEQFDKPTLDPRLRWFNPPPAWGLETGRLVVRPAPKTDFWQRTHYGFRADNGHFLQLSVAGDFRLSTKVCFRPAHQYDQAGLMVRLGPSCWIKASVEHEPRGRPKLGAVATNHGWSDWSLQDFPSGRNEVWFRIRRLGQAFLVEWARDSRQRWELLRMAHLHQNPGRLAQCGLYACSPKGGGFRAEFEFLRIATNPGSAKSHAP
jgi:regulation of enolase protein 1 (concanavalin A-like superfamily)